MRKRREGAYKLLNQVHEGLFTATNGLVGGTASGMTVVKLTTVGRKSGAERTTMLTSPLVEDNTVFLVASYRGGPKHPAWYLNLAATPQVQAMRRGADLAMRARTLDGEEREQVWRRVVSLQPRYATYQSRTERQLPLIELTPA